LDQKFIMRAAEITVNYRRRVWHQKAETRWGAAAQGHQQAVTLRDLDDDVRGNARYVPRLDDNRFTRGQVEGN
jgi:hypothetical protein